MEFFFNLQRFATVIVGKSSKDSLKNTSDNSQIYGLAGNDTIISENKENVIFIGGSGNDTLSLSGGLATLNGGAGKDIFSLNFSEKSSISAVIEDFSPNNDKIIINYLENDNIPNFSCTVEDEDLILTDDNGYFNVTIKGTREENDYYNSEGSKEIWEILRLVNVEREKENLSPLTLSNGLSRAANTRSQEIIKLFSHTRPDGSRFFTAAKKSYYSMGENLARSQTSTEEVMIAWMNSEGHRKNILREGFEKIGVAYTYNENTSYKHYWAQMFGGKCKTTETIETEKLLAGKVNLQINGSDVSDTTLEKISDNISGLSYNSAKTTLIINENFTGKEINLENYNKNVRNVDASAVSSEINIVGNKKANKIYTGSGNSTLNGGKNKDSIFGGEGNDIFIYEKGGNADKIYNFGAEDMISLASGVNISKITAKNSGIVLKVTGGSITVKNSSEITFIEDDTTKFFSNGAFTDENKVSATLSADFKGKFNLDEYQNADGSTVKKNITLMGNDENNSLIGGLKNDKIYGNAGNDILWGGPGNDTLYGGDDADIFIYNTGEGKDFILDFDSSDILKVTGDFSTDYNEKKNIFTLNLENGSVTLKNFTASTIKINDETYSIK